MSKPIDNGGPAFPSPVFNRPEGTVMADGMTLRDYFAAKAMAALVVASPYEEGSDEEIKEDAKEAAQISYFFADEMLAARKEKA